jgi:hypothetical protein
VEETTSEEIEISHVDVVVIHLVLTSGTTTTTTTTIGKMEASLVDKITITGAVVSYALAQLGRVRQSGGVDDNCFIMGAHHQPIVGHGVAPGIMHGGVVEKTVGVRQTIVGALVLAGI